MLLENFSPVLSLGTVDIVVPVTDPVLLVEARFVGADVGDPPPVLVAHVKDLTVVLCVCIEPHGPVRAVERESEVRKVLPPLCLRMN